MDYAGLKEIAKRLGTKHVAVKKEKMLDNILDKIEELMELENWADENQDLMEFYEANTEDDGEEEVEKEEVEKEEVDEEVEEVLKEVEEKVEKVKKKAEKKEKAKESGKKRILDPKDLDEFGLFPKDSKPAKFAAAIKKKPMKMAEIKKLEWNPTGASFYSPWKKLVAAGFGVKTNDGKLSIVKDKK